MAFNVAATAAGRTGAPARHADRTGMAATAASAARSTKAAAREAWNLGSSRCSSSSRSLMGCRLALITATEPLNSQHEQRQQWIKSNHCWPFLLIPDCERQGPALRQEIAEGQAAGAAAQSASSRPSAVARDAWTVDSIRAVEGRLAEQASGAPFGQTSTEAGCTRTTASSRKAIDPPQATRLAGQEAANADPLKGSGGVLSVAARLRPAVTTEAASCATQDSNAAEKSLRKRTDDQRPCCFSRATEMQRASGIQIAEAVHVEGKKRPHPMLSQLLCTYTVLTTAKPAITACRSSFSFSTGRVARFGAALPDAQQQRRRLSLSNTAVAASRAAAALPSGVVRQRISPTHRPLSYTAAVAVPKAAPVVAGCGRPARGAAGSVLQPVFFFLKSAAALGNPEATASVLAAVGVYAGSSPVSTCRQGTAVARRMASTSASGAAAAGCAAGTAPTGGAAASPGSGAAAAVAGRRKAVATLPLGRLYSKTHEYVRLLLEFVGPADDNTGTSAAAAAHGERKEGGDLVESHTPRPRRCQLVGFVGISAHAADELGEVVYCEYTRPLAAAAAAAAETGGADAATQRHPHQRPRRARADVAEAEGAEEAGGMEQEKMWVRRGSPICSLESVKSVAEVYSPVEGVVLGINAAATEEPALVWRHSEGDGWLVKLLLPLPAGSTTGNGGDYEVSPAYALHLTDADVAVTAADATTAAGNYATEHGPAATEAAAGGEASQETYAFMEACRDSVRLQDALVGLRRRLMGPDQYMQFVEREKKATGTEI